MRVRSPQRPSQIAEQTWEPRRQKNTCAPLKTGTAQCVPARDRKTRHTNVKEECCTFPTRPPSTSGPIISRSAPGAGPERDRTVGPVVNTHKTAASALRARSQRSSRPCASQAARSRGQDGMRWSPGGARANICGASGDPGHLREVVVGATGQPWQLHSNTCGGAHTGTRVDTGVERSPPGRKG